jgi:hypothetical protein
MTVSEGDHATMLDTKVEQIWPISRGGFEGSGKLG